MSDRSPGRADDGGCGPPLARGERCSYLRAHAMALGWRRAPRTVWGSCRRGGRG